MPLLNAESPVPLYFQLAEVLAERIRKGEYPPGGRIPSEHRLASMFGIGRPTVRQATERLVRQGLLVRRRGSGTFVQPEAREVDLLSFGGTLASFRKKGIDFDVDILSAPSLKRIKRDPHNPFSGQKAYFMSRLSRAEGEAVLLEHIYLDADRFAGINRFDLCDRSLSKIVADHYHLRPAGGRQTFRIGYPDDLLANCLMVSPQTPLLFVNRTIDFNPAPAAVYSELFCRTDRFLFSQVLGAYHHE